MSGKIRIARLILSVEEMVVASRSWIIFFELFDKDSLNCCDRCRIHRESKPLNSLFQFLSLLLVVFLFIEFVIQS